jgi:hypothetical protein
MEEWKDGRLERSPSILNDHQRNRLVLSWFSRRPRTRPFPDRIYLPFFHSSIVADRWGSLPIVSLTFRIESSRFRVSAISLSTLRGITVQGFLQLGNDHCGEKDASNLNFYLTLDFQSSNETKVNETPFNVISPKSYVCRFAFPRVPAPSLFAPAVLPD